MIKNGSFSMKNHIKDEPLTTTLDNKKKQHGEYESTYHNEEDERREHEKQRQRVCGRRRSENESDERARKATRASVWNVWKEKMRIQARREMRACVWKEKIKR